MTIRESILALLASGPRHGYQLKGEFETRTAGIWPLNVGQVYTTLERLERDGFVTGGEADADGRRPFELTAQGREELRSVLLQPTESDAPARDGLMLKVLIAVETDGVEALDVIQSERGARMSGLQARRRELRDAGVNGDLAAALAFDALITRAEAELRWLDVCEERILAARKSPNGSPNGDESKETT